MFCSQCGRRLEHSHRFCAACGAPAAGNESATAATASTTAPASPAPAASPGLAASSGGLPQDPLTAHVTQTIAAIKQDATGGQQFSMGSAALTLILFFLPWADVSCMGVTRSMSGYSLATNGSTLLWLVPIAMIVALVILYRVTLARPEAPDTPTSQNVLIATGFVAAGTMMVTYVSALEQMKADPIFGKMAAEMLKIRLFGGLAFLAAIATSLGAIVHRIEKQKTPSTPQADMTALEARAVVPSDTPTTGRDLR